MPMIADKIQWCHLCHSDRIQRLQKMLNHAVTGSEAYNVNENPPDGECESETSVLGERQEHLDTQDLSDITSAIVHTMPSRRGSAKRQDQLRVTPASTATMRLGQSDITPTGVHKMPSRRKRKADQ